MHVFRDTASIQDAHASALGSELEELLGRRIEELAEYEDHDLSELVHIHVIEPSDAKTQVEAKLGQLRLCDDRDLGRVSQRGGNKGLRRGGVSPLKCIQRLLIRKCQK